MDSSKFDYISMSQYPLEMDPNSANENFRCTICKKLMIDACHSTCGCQYCWMCIHDHQRDGNYSCPGENIECSKYTLEIERDVVRNQEINDNICQLKVLCPNESCRSSLPFSEMEEHMRLCIKLPLLCPYSNLGCEKKSDSKETLLIHLHTELLEHTTLLIKWMYKSQNEVDRLKHKFDLNTIEIANLKIDSKLKDKQIGEINEQMKCMKEESKKKEIQMLTLAQEISILKREINYAKGESKYVKASLEPEIEVKASALKVESDIKMKVEHVSRVGEESHNRMDKLKTTIDKIRLKSFKKPVVGIMTVTVDKFSTRKTNEEIISPHFYSHNNGYKLRLLIYPRNESINIPCLWVSFAICKGEFDNNLPWPCQYSINISITNQNNGKTHNSVTYKYSTIPECHKNIFNKPSNKEAIANMFDTLISHEDLLSAVGVVVNDSIVIKCSLSPPG